MPNVREYHEVKDCLKYAECESYTVVKGGKTFPKEPVFPVVIYNLKNTNLAAVKSVISPLARAVTAHGEEKTVGTLCADDNAAVIFQPELISRERYGFYEIEDIVKRLRGEGGCPWDRAQTHDSIRINLIEEAYELVDAIEQKDFYKMREEAGDVLLQALFHSVMAEEEGGFTTDDMLSALADKLITRHTHIFGGEKAGSESEALKIWEKNKMTEKKQSTYASAVNDVPKCFPALLRAEKVQKRAKKSGFEFSDKLEIVQKVMEELNEVIGSIGTKNLEMECGDLLFSCVNLIRFLGEEPEQALRLSTDKFAARFTAMEEMITSDGKKIDELDMKALDGYYDRAKRQENSK